MLLGPISELAAVTPIRKRQSPTKNRRPGSANADVVAVCIVYVRKNQ